MHGHRTEHTPGQRNQTQQRRNPIMQFLFAIIATAIMVLAVALGVGVPARRALQWRRADTQILKDRPAFGAAAAPHLANGTPPLSPQRSRAAMAWCVAPGMVAAAMALLRGAVRDRCGASERRRQAAQAYSSRPLTPIPLDVDLFK